MRRKPQFETLDQRLCFAFGDIDPGFAQVGEYSVSYSELDRMYSTVTNVFNLPSGYLVTASSQSGSGNLVTIAKFDANGAADTSFGDGGLSQFIDSDAPKSVVSKAIQLSDGRLVLFSGTGSSYMSFIGVRPDGTIHTGFGDAGFVRLGEQLMSDFTMIADPAGGYLTVESSPQTFRSVVRRYFNDGQVNQAFGNNGALDLSTRLTNSAIAVNAQGVITIVGNDTLDGLKLKSYRFDSSGLPDSSFATNGVGTGDPIFTGARINLSDDGQSFTLISLHFENNQRLYDLTRYAANTERDTSFGVSGVATLPTTRLSANDNSDATLLTFGDGSYRLAVFDTDFFTVQSRLTTYKLLSNGTLDAGFGIGGSVEQLINQRVTPLKVLPDGTGGVFWTGIVQPVTNANFLTDTLMIHTDANGLLDAAWDGDGIKTLSFTPASQSIDWMQLDPLGQGRMRVLSGWPTYDVPQPNLGKAETLDADGVVLSSSDFGRTVSKQYTVTSPSADGGWYIAQFLNNEGINRIEISKFFSTGAQDNSFGTSGIMTVATDGLWTIVMRTSRDGSVAIAGATLADDADPATSQGVAVIIRLAADGTPMQSFGAGGVKRIYSKTGNLADVLVDPNLGVVLVYDPYFDPGIIMQRYTDTGVLDTRFDTTGVLPFLDWSATEVDETGRILIVAHGFESFLPYILYQFGTNGQLITSFGTGGHVELPITRQPELASVALSVRQGVISVASAHTRDNTVVRLLAYDYAGKPLLELDSDGVRDYELTPDGEQVADLQFSDDGSLWLATMNREKFDLFGKVIKLEGSSSPTLHNWSIPLDVTLDGRVTAFDALIVISALNGIAPPAGMLTDTNADTRLTAIDALLIINRLNTQGGEGEAEPAPVVSAPAAAHDAVMDTYGEIEAKRLSRRR